MGLPAALRRLLDRVAWLVRRLADTAPPRPRPAAEPAALRGATRSLIASARSADVAAPPVQAPRRSLPWGDFTGALEAARFAVLPPLGADAAEAVDWDALARELSGPR